MPLYDPPANPRLSREEFDSTALTRPTGFGEYMSSALRQGWDVSGIGAFARDPFGASQRFGPLPDQPLETSKAMGYDVDLPRLTEEQWQKAGLAREGLAYEGGTLDHERSRTEEFDRKRYHESVVARYQGNVLAYAAGFGARVVGGAASPENFIPFVGPGMRAAMVARLGVIGGHAAVGAIDNVIGTALTDAYVLPQMAREGETVTAGDLAMDLTLGAVAGTVLGSAGGWLERRRAAANAIRTPGVVPHADALDAASEALDTGTPVDVGGYIRSTDSVQRLQRMAPELTDEGPATLTESRSIFTEEAEQHADRFLEVFNAAKSGDILELPAGRYQVNVSRDGTRRTLMQLDDEGNATGIIYSADEGKTGAAVYLGRDMAAAAGPGGRTVTRTLDEPLEGGGRHQQYEVTEAGRPIARALVGVHGDRAIVGAIGPTDPNAPAVALGHRQLRELAAAIKRDNPEVQWIEGERVTGARKAVGERGPARVSINRLIGGRREPPDLTTTAAPEPRLHEMTLEEVRQRWSEADASDVQKLAAILGDEQKARLFLDLEARALSPDEHAAASAQRQLEELAGDKADAIDEALNAPGRSKEDLVTIEHALEEARDMHGWSDDQVARSISISMERFPPERMASAMRGEPQPAAVHAAIIRMKSALQELNRRGADKSAIDALVRRSSVQAGATLDQAKELLSGYARLTKNVRIARQPDLTTTAAPEPPEPSVIAAETSYKVVPPDFTAEQAARIKEQGLDAESYAADQALITQARKQGDLTAAHEAELEAGELAAKAHEDEATAYEAMQVCVGRHG